MTPWTHPLVPQKNLIRHFCTCTCTHTLMYTLKQVSTCKHAHLHVCTCTTHTNINAHENYSSLVIKDAIVPPTYISLGTAKYWGSYRLKFSNTVRENKVKKIILVFIFFMLRHVFTMLKSVCMCLWCESMSALMDMCTHMKVQRRSSSVFLCGPLPISLRQRLSEPTAC